MKLNPRHLLHIVGGAISLILIGYLAFRFFELRSAIASQLPNGFPLAVMGLATTTCLLAYLPISIGWSLLAAPGRSLRSLPVATEIVLLSQAARYLPGNVGHLVGRVMLTSRHMSVSAKLGSALVSIELMLSLACAGLLSTSALPQLAPLVPSWLADLLKQPWTIAFGMLMVVAGICILGAAARRWLNLAFPPASTLMAAAIFYATALVVGGISLWLLLGIEHSAQVHFGLALLAYTTSWLAGFITPGAPSGLGVREFILVRLLAPVVGEPQALLVAALLRLCSVSADVVAFAIGLGLMRQGRKDRSARNPHEA
jgi:uncharacterized membrane protein YbhN (UPF0104 family)